MKRAITCLPLFAAIAAPCFGASVLLDDFEGQRGGHFLGRQLGQRNGLVVAVVLNELLDGGDVGAGLLPPSPPVVEHGLGLGDPGADGVLVEAVGVVEGELVDVAPLEHGASRLGSLPLHAG